MIRVLAEEQPRDFLIPHRSLDFTVSFNGSVKNGIEQMASGKLTLPDGSNSVYTLSARLSSERGYDVVYKLTVLVDDNVDTDGTSTGAVVPTTTNNNNNNKQRQQ